MKRVLLLLLFIFVLPLVAHATFKVSFKDGTTKEVQKIVFRNEFADLYVTTGAILRINIDAIDFRVTGMAPPAFPYGVSVDGRTVDKIEESQLQAPKSKAQAVALPQDKLKALFDESRETATANEDIRGMRKGQTVRVVSTTDSTVTVVYFDTAEQQYRRLVLETEAFDSAFQSSAPKPMKQMPPAQEPLPTPITQKNPSPEITFRIPQALPEPQKQSSTNVPLWIAPVMSLALLVLGSVFTVAVRRSNSPKNKKAG